MRKILSVMIGLMVCTHVTAKTVVDLYGDQSVQSEKIIKKYTKQIIGVEASVREEFTLGRKPSTEKEFEKKVLNRIHLIEKIKKEGGYLYADINTVFYPGDVNEYVTIEVVKKNQPDRLRFVSPASETKNYQSKNDLINEMIRFEMVESQLMLNNKLDLNKTSCPVYHCVSGFFHPQLKPYLKIFNTGAIKERALIINTLNHDPDPERRAAAAFLMGHFANPHEIISLLLPHVNDHSPKVRNNVLRVIGSTLYTAKITKIDVRPFLDLLQSPFETDRNKSLLILQTASEANYSKPEIIKNGGESLLALLQLKQPNNHRPAYQILQRVSGKNYSEYDLSSWKNWIESAQRNS